MDEGIVLGALLGAQDGLQQRANAEMLRQGIRPRFWQRHPMLPYVLGVLLALPAWLLFIRIASVIPWWMHTSIVIDRHLGRTGLIAVLLWTWPLWALMLRVFWRNERRWRRGQTVAQTRLPNTILAGPARMEAPTYAPSWTSPIGMGKSDSSVARQVVCAVAVALGLPALIFSMVYLVFLT